MPLKELIPYTAQMTRVIIESAAVINECIGLHKSMALSQIISFNSLR
jgi:hypothetical protein